MSLLNSSSSNRIDAKETAVVVAKTEEEETVAGTSLRFSIDVVGRSTQHAAAAAPRLKNKNEHVFCCNLYLFLQNASRLNRSAVNIRNRSIAV